ncbi:hypothetical protein L6164_008615 [Bauhinia variegata]|uniref:Uncharacterized protein n=1 Tax=Bauhinia variegata TaxID=167791 RepID=A0ACB9PK26_BAUVA|nr:hypothetical protein L6164_008615 [Bauhinia variegata]
MEEGYNWQSTVVGNPAFRRCPKVKGLRVGCWQKINFGSLRVAVGKSHDLKIGITSLQLAMEQYITNLSFN